eukprot:g54289.t1
MIQGKVGMAPSPRSEFTLYHQELETSCSRLLHCNIKLYQLRCYGPRPAVHVNGSARVNDVLVLVEKLIDDGHLSSTVNGNRERKTRTGCVHDYRQTRACHGT